jgi:uncharacterized protein YjbI with pentapeptide repeats
MNIYRRSLLAAAAAICTSQVVNAHENEKQVTQDELDEAVKLHGVWLADINSGRRCMFGGRNLSGLQFRALGGQPVDLNGADFAQADLSETEADDIFLHHCNFNGAKFDGCHWRHPVFAFADMRRVSAKGVAWGTPRSRGPAERLLADFSHTVLNYADLSEAQICGLFYGTKFLKASLLQADLSLSEFMGPKHYEMSFSGARLRGAKLRHCRISSASFYEADCSDVDFSHSDLSDVRMIGCNLTGACFRGAEIEQTVFSPDQIGQAIFEAL